MKPNSGADASAEKLYDVSAVSRLTGLSTPNLRVWEKRYGLVSPSRSKSRRRLYSSEDIRRLTLLKGLVDRGHPIGSIASLDTPELERRLHEETGRNSRNAAPRTAAACRLIVIGAELDFLLEDSEGLEGTSVVARRASLEEARQESARPRADLVLVECPTLFPETVLHIQEYVRSTTALRAVVVYRFAHGQTAQMVAKDIESITAMRGPVDVSELQLACQAEIALMRPAAGPADQALTVLPRPAADVPCRLFSDADLARVSRISSGVECECPQHLAGLLSSLNAFEQYSLQCEDRNPEDAAIHAALHQSTARARRTMELALGDLMTAEGIALP